MHGNPMVIVSAYMPHVGSDNSSRDRTWEDPNGYVRKIPEAVNVNVIGDLSISLHARKEGEEYHIGPNIWKRRRFLKTHGINTTHQQKILPIRREHLVLLLRAKDMTIANTLFQKEDTHIINYRKKDNNVGGPSWNTNRYVL